VRWKAGAVAACCVYRWLIEVNASPSLTASSKEDYDLKCRLLDDVLNVVDLENRYTIIFVVFVHLAANYSTNIYNKQWLPECCVP